MRLRGHSHRNQTPQSFPSQPLAATPFTGLDQFSGRTNPWAVGGSAMVNGLVAALVILLGMRAMHGVPHRASAGSHVDLSDLHLLAPRMGQDNGGSGGHRDLIDPVTGRPPQFESTPQAPPQTRQLENPVLPLDAAVAAEPVQLPNDASMPLVGVARSSNVALASNGHGGGSGIGWKKGNGDGPGNGNGYGPGANNGVYIPGNGVSQPVPLVTPEAEFSDEARRQKYTGVCLVEVIVDAQGMPRNPRVVRRLGMGLDEKALEAVEQYRFKPAKKDGKPVAARIFVSVDFRLF